MKVKLFAPEVYGTQPCNYHDATPEQIAEVAGGCGPGGVGDYFIPDRLWFLSIKAACRIHDWMYHYGRTIEDKILADRIFKNNMVRLVKGQNSWGFIENRRLDLVSIYYIAVKDFGGPSFWDHKNSHFELQ